MTDRTDRELLEAAAKAAGMEGWTYGGEFGMASPPRTTPYGVAHSYWNPLNYSGDALDLAVKLRIEIVFWPQGVSAEIQGSPHCSLKLEQFLEDPYAATRRAIVRAAAAMSPG